ncbi:MAG: hypothetical protein ACI9WU_005056, partial [Myxococcota bacterium]
RRISDAAVAELPSGASGTQRMAARLAALAADPEFRAHRFASGFLADRAASKNPTKPRALIRLARHEIQAGRLDAAIARLEPLATAPEMGTRALHLLAVAHLRRGEQQNCCARNTPESCLYPLAGEGIHSSPAGAREAARVLERIMDANPEQLEPRWLYHIATMALGRSPSEIPTERRIPVRAPGAVAHPRFVNVAQAAGVDTFGLAGGVVMEDLDGDGDLDLLVSSFGFSDPLVLLVNDGKGKFAQRDAGLQGITGGLNLVHADYDNDGDADVLVLRGGWLRGHRHQPNSLLRNRGDGTFDDVTEAAGVLSHATTQTAAWADFNNDGVLDLFIGNERREPGTPPSELYLGDGKGRFREVAAQAGVATQLMIKGVAAGDYDNDGRMDLYLSDFRGPNHLLRNTGQTPDGIPQFEDRTAAAGVAEPEQSFPTWWFDYDNDGLQDLFVSGYGARPGDEAAAYLGSPHPARKPRLYRNRGDGTFSDVSVAAGLTWPAVPMGANFGDIDHDGHLDFYLGTGSPSLSMLVANRLYRGTGTGFQDITESAGVGHLQKGHGVAIGDLDGDGDQDIFAVMGGAYADDGFFNALFQNPGGGGHWLLLHLEGVTANRSAIGARIRVEATGPAGTVARHRVVSTGGSFGSNPLRESIGLADATVVDRVEILWPGSGTRQVWNGPIPINTRWTIREDAPPVAVE